MTMTAEKLVSYRKRTNAPTSFEKRNGYVPHRRDGGGCMSMRGPSCARPIDYLANARANGYRRHYSYMTNAETWKIRWGK